tara:strand:+ start:142 stop:699 length:558 start_codon:yes stop_codon:yes gene_type:complete
MDPEVGSSQIKLDVSVYRFKLNQSLVEEITKFAKSHASVDRKTFQKEWREWLSDNADTVNDEKKRLNDLGFRGDPIDKMYKSARYYFRNKPENSSEHPKQAPRKQYVASSKSLLELMNRHILNNITGDSYTPANGFDAFCHDNIEALREEVNMLQSRGQIDAKAISNKLKKTYKNRYYQISRSTN